MLFLFANKWYNIFKRIPSANHKLLTISTKGGKLNYYATKSNHNQK